MNWFTKLHEISERGSFAVREYGRLSLVVLCACTPFFHTALAFALPLSWNAGPLKGKTTTHSLKRAYQPCYYAEERSKELWHLLYGQDGKENDTKPQRINVAAARNAWVAAMYQIGVVEASKKSQLLGDHLLASLFLPNVLPKAYTPPKTIGLKCFLLKNSLVDTDGKVTATPEAIQAALKREYPNGFQLRTSSVIPNLPPDEPLLLDGSHLARELLRSDSSIYQPQEISQAHVNPRTGTPLSGERFVIRDLPRERNGKILRVHTLGSNVVKDATLPRYPERDSIHEGEKVAANSFVKRLLSSLPESFMHGTGWAVDLYMVKDGADGKVQMQFLDLHTNLGLEKSWSVFQSHPMVLGAYTRHIESHEGIEFTGLSGFLLRHNLGNLPKFLQKKLLQGWL